MAWQDTMIIMLRILVNDVEDTPTYSDSRMEQILTVSAMYVNQEMDFDNTYTVDVVSPDISPDPVGVNDIAFINFVVLKAACITDFSTFRTKALQSGIKAKCGPATLETTKHLDGFKQLLESGPCQAYEALKQNWVFGDGRLIKAIMSPFVSNDFDPQGLASSCGNYGGHRGGQYDGFGGGGGNYYMNDICRG